MTLKSWRCLSNTTCLVNSIEGTAIQEMVRVKTGGSETKENGGGTEQEKSIS